MLEQDPNTGLAFTLHRLPPDQDRPPTRITPVICLHGSGAPPHHPSWATLISLLAQHTTVLFYERRSSTPSAAVHDLDSLLAQLHLSPPYILLPHSSGGTLARAYLHRHPARAAGMVLAETGQETPTPHDEQQYRRRALRAKPLSVIHANSLLRMPESADPAVREMSARFAAEDERLKKAQLRLSSNARYVRVEDCGHNVVRERPGVVLEEVRWVLENLKGVEKEEGTGLQGFWTRLWEGARKYA